VRMATNGQGHQLASTTNVSTLVIFMATPRYTRECSQRTEPALGASRVCRQLVARARRACLWRATMAGVISLNAEAPPFVLEGVEEGKTQRFALGDYRGRWVILVFYPADFTFVCPTEIQGLRPARSRPACPGV
jgi:AhpC/TSA family